jgi:hypothetical protein
VDDDKLVVLCTLAIVETDFDPTKEIDADAEQFLRVNIEAQRERLPQFLAHVMTECYRLGRRDRDA